MAMSFGPMILATSSVSSSEARFCSEDSSSIEMGSSLVGFFVSFLVFFCLLVSSVGVKNSPQVLARSWSWWIPQSQSLCFLSLQFSVLLLPEFLHPDFLDPELLDPELPGSEFLRQWSWQMLSQASLAILVL